MDTCWDQAVEAEALPKQKAYSLLCQDLAGQLGYISSIGGLGRGQAVAFDFS